MTADDQVDPLYLPGQFAVFLNPGVGYADNHLRPPGFEGGHRFPGRLVLVAEVHRFTLSHHAHGVLAQQGEESNPQAVGKFHQMRPGQSHSG